MGHLHLHARKSRAGKPHKRPARQRIRRNLHDFHYLCGFLTFFECAFAGFYHIGLRIGAGSDCQTSRATQGVRIINLDKRGDTIASACCVPADPEQEVVAVAPDAEGMNHVWAICEVAGSVKAGVMISTTFAAS